MWKTLFFHIPISEEYMLNYRGVIFDVDGTIINSTELICRCFQYVADVYGIELPRGFVWQEAGQPIRDSMRRLHPTGDVDAMVRDYRVQQKALVPFPLNSAQ